jgi:hypothetical protein
LRRETVLIKYRDFSRKFDVNRSYTANADTLIEMTLLTSAVGIMLKYLLEAIEMTSLQYSSESNGLLEITSPGLPIELAVAQRQPTDLGQVNIGAVI